MATKKHTARIIGMTLFVVSALVYEFKNLMDPVSVLNEILLFGMLVGVLIYGYSSGYMHGRESKN
jgi:NADH:ubiquinone oxidoreductase subunit 5 (subunit L)/multisubunit Na+/H+ antiporter MnhA subunit